MDYPPEGFESRTGVTSSIPSMSEQQDYWDDRWENSRTPNSWQLRQGGEILKILDEFHIRDVPILDVGCGTGWLTAELQGYGDAAGIDLSKTGIDIARVNHPDIEFIADDFLEVPFPENHYGLIVAQEVIAHIYDQEAFVQKLYRMLKAQGYLIITTANRFVIKRLELGYERSGHIKKWLSLHDLKRLLDPSFQRLTRRTVLPMGHKGVLRLVNSWKLNRGLQLFLAEEKLTDLKEKLGLGYTRIILYQKKALH